MVFACAAFYFLLLHVPYLFFSLCLEAGPQALIDFMIYAWERVTDIFKLVELSPFLL
jgi:hypothetical protein